LLFLTALVRPGIPSTGAVGPATPNAGSGLFYNPNFHHFGFGGSGASKYFDFSSGARCATLLGGFLLNGNPFKPQTITIEKNRPMQPPTAPAIGIAIM
jgi:hypothetical protein